MIKKNVFCLGIILTLAAMCFGCSKTETKSSASPVADAVEITSDIPTLQAFTDEAVNDEDLKTIISAGINAPSAMNSQPWHFSVVTDKDILQQISDDMGAGIPPKPGDKPETGDKPSMGDKPPAGDGDKKDFPAPPAGGPMTAKAGIADAPVAVIISCTDGSDFNAGLACESMADTANLMGYGTKIISSPTIALNGEKKDEYKKLLDIPADKSAVAVLLIGHPKESADSVTGATERNPFDDVVSMIK